MNEDRLKKGPSFLLCVFIYGSLFVLLACLSAASLFFSETYLKKEKLRAKNYSEMLAQSFEIQYRAITEEMWTHNYEAIHLRINEIVKDLGKSNYTMVLTDSSGNCVYSSNPVAIDASVKSASTSSHIETCTVPEQLRKQIVQFQPESVEPFLDFDTSLNRYVYIVPLYVGAALKGYLFTSVVDPYDFYRGTSLGLAFRIFFIPFAIILLVWLVWLVVSYSWVLKPYLTMLIGMKKKDALANLALQVAHDIRSPSVALNSVAKNLSGVGIAQRKILTLAASRIENIANELLDQFGSNSQKEDSFCFLATGIESIISEKRAILGERSRIEIEISLPLEIQCVGLPISETDFSRVMSNLLNNSIDSLQQSSILKPLIRVYGAMNGDRVSICIEDNGPGIQPETLRQIQMIGGSFGKTGGNGLGLKHAKEVVTRASGSLAIDSKVDYGTIVTLNVPVASVPKWCATALDLSDAKMIVILDDDDSVHALWKQRLAGFTVRYFDNPSQISLSEYPLEECKFVVDFDLGKDCPNGLEWISQHGLGCRAILCTNNFSDPSIQKSAQAVNTQILPKFMISSVPILSTPIAPIECSDKALNQDRIDLVLIDDDPLIRELWDLDSIQAGKRLLSVGTLQELNLDTLSRNTPVFVDKNLDGISGFEVARVLHDKGFQNLHLTTGEKLKKEDVPEFIKGVMNKDFPVQF